MTWIVLGNILLSKLSQLCSTSQNPGTTLHVCKKTLSVHASVMTQLFLIAVAASAGATALSPNTFAIRTLEVISDGVPRKYVDASMRE